MFVFNELDKLLQDIAGGAGRKFKSNNVQISIPDIEPIDIARLELPAKLNLPYGPPLTYDQMALDGFQHSPFDRTSSLIIDGQRYPTTNSLFLKLMNQFVFSRVVRLPERHYPWAKLLLCDRYSYDLLLKHERILSLSASGLRNFLYRAPFVITAIFELDNIVNLFERSGESLILMRRDPQSGKSVPIYSYAPVRKVFPYLRMSDLLVLIEDKDLLDAKSLRLLHYLGHYARSSQMIELGGLNKILGFPHPIYNNVLVIQPKQPIWTDYYSQLPFAHLSFMATQLASIADKLKLRLETVTYRASDPHQQTKVFAHFLATAVDKKAHDLLDSRIGRVLVLDRFHDLRGTLLHADRFEAFLAQEHSQVNLLASSPSATGGHLERPTLGSVDEQLNSKLHLVRLTEILGVILSHAMQLKPAGGGGGANKGRQKGRRRAKRSPPLEVPAPQSRHTLSAAMSASQSIRRNLDTVKILYKSLNEGYLILLKLESSLESITAELRLSQQKPLDESRQVAIAERLLRLVAACKQLHKVETKTIDSSDIIRFSCLIVDTINLFSAHNSSSKAVATLGQARDSMLKEKDIKTEEKSKFDSATGDSATSNLFKKYLAFESLSASTSGQRSTLLMEEMLEQLLEDRLDEKAYPVHKLVETATYTRDTKITVVLIFLGALTAHELAKLKIMESQLKKRIQLCDVLVLTSALVAPHDFLRTL